MKCSRLVHESMPTSPPNTETDRAAVPAAVRGYTRDDRNIIIDSDAFEGYVRDDKHCEGHFSGESAALKRPEFSRKNARKSGEGT